jgi:transcriptional regulator with XRE-family HTH domain
MNGKLVKIRRQKGMTQAEVAKRSGVSRGYLAQLEVGHKSAPSVAVLKRLAKVLGVGVEELLR